MIVASFFILLIFIIVVIKFTVKRPGCCTCDKTNDSNNVPRETVRQVPVYTIGSDPRCNDTTSNFTDYFWNVSSQNTRANEPTKDDKDLPSYEDIMRMEMARQVIDSAVQAPITTTTIHTVETSQPPPPPATSPPVRLPV
ncbi:uncharacterized protein LOC129951000 isoform X3 [Eupeodes corollae]|uniref:uncharacterized protein LOC129951000 isoform X3 n=1 Tax=Eupeodes corollae TaxID=290404 RepID=UPI00249083E4|nr:uncharacterized protein LOC129951000 isoform X3 [Eupeodes corollae]